MGEESKRIVKTPSDLIFYTDTEKSDYPIFISNDYEVFIKARPFRTVQEQDEYGYTTTRRVYDIPVIATFHVKEVVKIEDDGISHELLDLSINAIREITKKDPEMIKKLQITYEVYKGDVEKLLGEAKAYCIKVISYNVPYSGSKGYQKKVWAIAYDWKKRLLAKYPQLSPFTYVKGEEGRRSAHAWITVKLPVVTKEFETLFYKALSIPTPTSEIDEMIRKIEEEINKKEKEIEELRKQLEELKRKKEIPGRIASL